MSRLHKSLNYSRNRIYFVQSCINRSFVYLQLRLSSYRCNIRTFILDSSVNEARNSLTLNLAFARKIVRSKVNEILLCASRSYQFFFLEFNEKENCLFLSLSGSLPRFMRLMLISLTISFICSFLLPSRFFFFFNMHPS